MMEVYSIETRCQKMYWPQRNKKIESAVQQTISQEIDVVIQAALHATIDNWFHCSQILSLI